MFNIYNPLIQLLKIKYFWKIGTMVRRWRISDFIDTTMLPLRKKNWNIFLAIFSHLVFLYFVYNIDVLR